MDEHKKNEFIKLVGRHKILEMQMEELAWEITPDDIRELLCGESGLYPYRQDLASKWLVRPRRRELNNKCPMEVIIAGGVDEIKKFLNRLIAGVYF